MPQVTEAFSHTLVIKYIFNMKIENAWGGLDKKPENAVQVTAEGVPVIEEQVMFLFY